MEFLFDAHRPQRDACHLDTLIGAQYKCVKRGARAWTTTARVVPNANAASETLPSTNRHPRPDTAVASSSPMVTTR